MRKQMKNAAGKIIAFLLVAVMGIAGLGTLNVEAAANKALCVSYSFNGQNYEENGDECGENNNYGIYVYGTSKKTAVKNLKISADIYIPKTALKKDGAIIDVTPYFDMMDDKGNYVGNMIGKISLSVVNENGKVKLYGASYGTCKAGTGKYKSYYVLKLKSVPVMEQMFLENGKTITVKKNTKYAFNMGISITGENNKGSGKLYIDNMKVTAGSKTIVSENFSKTPKYYGAFNRGKELSKNKVKIVKF